MLGFRGGETDHRTELERIVQEIENEIDWYKTIDDPDAVRGLRVAIEIIEGGPRE